MTCTSCGSDLDLRTRHLKMVRGTTLSFTHVVRDQLNKPRDLTGATAFLAIRADIKVAPTLKLTSDVTPPDGWRTGIVFSDQVQSKGELVVTLIPADTLPLIAMGHDDPWLYDLMVQFTDGSVSVEISMSILDIYPQVTDIP